MSVSTRHISSRAKRYREHIFRYYIEPLRRDGLSDRAIAEHLNERDIPGFFSRARWNRERVNHIRRQI